MAIKKSSLEILPLILIETKNLYRSIILFDYANIAGNSGHHLPTAEPRYFICKLINMGLNKGYTFHHRSSIN